MQGFAENEQKQNSASHDLSVRFLAVFKNNSGEATFPEFSYCKSGTGECEVMRCLGPAELDGAASACLHMLHPQARNFIAQAVTHFRLAGPLSRELEKTIWKGKAPAWAGRSELGDVLEQQDDGWMFDFKIADIGAVLFPTHILMLYVDVVPAFKLSDGTALPAAKLLLHSFVRAGHSFSGGGYKGLAVKRIRQEQCESAIQRMGVNSLELIQGFCGMEVSLVDIVKGLLPNECFTDGPIGRNCSSAFLMGDRFLAYTFLKTNWDGHGRAFSEQDHLDLIRLSRAEADNYEPARDPVSPDEIAFVKTFENVAFSPSAEGVACWVKPGKDQDFLNRQFKRDRYETIYFQLYLLALHQRYALVNLATRLEDPTPCVGVFALYSSFTHDGNFEKIEECAELMRQHRIDVSNFYLRAFFQQPATLTNHQEFYHALQKTLGVSELLDEVRQSASELEYLIGSLHERKSLKRHQESVSKQAEQHKSRLQQIARLISEQERSAKSHLFLTLVVELTAIPYYAFHFLRDAFHVSDHLSRIISIGLAILTATATIFVLLKKSKGGPSGENPDLALSGDSTKDPKDCCGMPESAIHGRHGSA